MTLGSSIVLLVLVVAAIGLAGFVRLALKAPRRKKEVRRNEVSISALADPPTITHYGHA